MLSPFFWSFSLSVSHQYHDVVFLSLSFYFKIVVDFQKSCKDNIESSYIFYIQVSQLLTSFLHYYAYLSQLMNGIVCFIYSLMSHSSQDSFNYEALHPMTQGTYTAHQLLVCLPASSHTNVLCPSQKQARHFPSPQYQYSNPKQIDGP